MRSREELVKIGKDMAQGLIFTSNHIREHDMQDVASIFMPLLFMDEKTAEEFKQTNPFVLFEYLDKAGPRSMNGYPTFFSMGHMNKEEWGVVWEIYEKTIKALEEVK